MRCMNAEVKKGIRDSCAVGLGMVPLGIAFGVLMVQTGFDWWWAPIFSFVIYAGSMEFLAITMVTGGTGVLTSLVTGFMVNFRHIFYGLSFPRENIQSTAGKAYSTYAITDETYAIVSALPRGTNPSGTRLLTIQVLLQCMWVGGGIIGALGGQVIPEGLKGLEFALVALFIVLAMDAFKNNPDYSLPLSAAALGILAALIVPQQLLTVGLTAFFLLLVARYFSPRLDEALTWRRVNLQNVEGER